MTMIQLCEWSSSGGDGATPATARLHVIFLHSKLVAAFSSFKRRRKHLDPLSLTELIIFDFDRRTQSISDLGIQTFGYKSKTFGRACHYSFDPCHTIPIDLAEASFNLHPSSPHTVQHLKSRLHGRDLIEQMFLASPSPHMSLGAIRIAVTNGIDIHVMARKDWESLR